MKPLSITLSIPQLQEIRSILNAAVTTTIVIHTLTYAEIVSLYKAYNKIILKCNTMIFRKQNKDYQFSFVPQEAEAIIKTICKSNLTLNAYGQITVQQFTTQFDKQSEDLKRTFLSQYKFK